MSSIASITHNPNGSDQANEINLSGQCQVEVATQGNPGENKSEIATLGYGLTKVKAGDQTKIKIGDRRKEGDLTTLELKLELSQVLSLPGPKLAELVASLGDKLGVYQPSDLKYIEENDLDALGVGKAQKPRLLDYVRKMKQADSLPSPPTDPPGIIVATVNIARAAGRSNCSAEITVSASLE